MNLRRYIPALFSVFCASMSTAHELWVEPETWQLPQGETLRADIRNGELFSGTTLVWLDRNIARAELSVGGTEQAYAGRLGDRPALVTQPEGDGLGVVIYETTPASITYHTWEKFAKFVSHKDLGITKDAHLGAGHPEEGFKESYTRHTKALVALGDGEGKDQTFGLVTEIVAETNPYGADFDGEMTVQLLYQSVPRAAAQIEVFERPPDGGVKVSMITTAQDGRASFPVSPGHAYLLDAVVLRPGSDGDAIYDTLWAGLSFYVP